MVWSRLQVNCWQQSSSSSPPLPALRTRRMGRVACGVPPRRRRRRHQQRQCSTAIVVVPLVQHNPNRSVVVVFVSSSSNNSTTNSSRATSRFMLHPDAQRRCSSSFSTPPSPLLHFLLFFLFFNYTPAHADSSSSHNFFKTSKSTFLEKYFRKFHRKHLIIYLTLFIINCNHQHQTLFFKHTVEKEVGTDPCTYPGALLLLQLYRFDTPLELQTENKSERAKILSLFFTFLLLSFFF